MALWGKTEVERCISDVMGIHFAGHQRRWICRGVTLRSAQTSLGDLRDLSIRCDV